MTEEVKLRAEIGKLKFLSANFYSGLVKNWLERNKPGIREQVIFSKKVIKRSVNMAF